MIEVTCRCGRVLKVPDSAIGKQGRCKGCGQTIDIIAIPTDGPDAMTGDQLSAIPIGDSGEGIDLPISAPIGTLATESRGGRRMPPEPWYYGFLVLYSWVCIVIGVGQFAYHLLLGTGQSGAVMNVGRVVVSFGSMLGIILVSCPILLAVDVARNIRAMRYSQ